jgi:pyruvyl transferase EpsI
MNVFDKALKVVLTRFDMYKYVEYLRGKRETYKLPDTEGKRIFFMMVPSYGNIGDQAICYATQKYLDDKFSDYTTIRITIQDTYKAIATIEKVIRPDDIVVLQGGGNFGNLYGYIESARRFIVRHLRNNKIISFPCTITYQDNRAGRKDLWKAKKIYNFHKDLTLMSRDEKSFEFAKEHFNKCKNLLIPDMVFYLWEKPSDDLDKRNGVCACLRYDPERAESVDRSKIIKRIASEYEDYMIVDTQLSRSIWNVLRKEEIHSIVKVLSSGRVVVTDRLHGMLLSVISGTPCVVLPSGGNKTYGTYSWIKELDSVVYCESGDEDEVMEQVKRLYSLEKADFLDLKKKYFETLRDKITG